MDQPYFLKDGKRREYATEEELLEFANKIRKAGGANVIDAFFPSTPGNPASCLIANALNFGCMVDGNGVYPDGDGDEYQWEMTFPVDMYGEEATRIAKELDLPVASYEGINGDVIYGVKLPRLIGNTAEAFDSNCDGWIAKYRQEG